MQGPDVRLRHQRCVRATAHGKAVRPACTDFLRACRAQTIGDTHVPVISRVAFPPTLGHIRVTLSPYANGNGSTNDEDFAY